MSDQAPSNRARIRRRLGGGWSVSLNDREIAVNISDWRVDGRAGGIVAGEGTMLVLEVPLDEIDLLDPADDRDPTIMEDR